jgi:hypothetical protein
MHAQEQLKSFLKKKKHKYFRSKSSPFTATPFVSKNHWALPPMPGSTPEVIQSFLIRLNAILNWVASIVSRHLFFPDQRLFGFKDRRRIFCRRNKQSNQGSVAVGRFWYAR